MMIKLLWSMVFVVVLFRISYTDLKYRVIGKRETGILLGLGCLFYFVPLWNGWCGGMLSGLFLAGLVELVNLVCFRLKGIGGGDVRLLFVMGFMLGTDRGLLVLLVALVIALVVMVFVCFYYKFDGDSNNGDLNRVVVQQYRVRDGIKRMRIPLGPFLAVGFGIQVEGLLWFG